MSAYEYIDKPMPTESRMAYGYYCIYRDLGPQKRALRKVLEIIGRGPKYMRSIERYSSVYQWVARVHAFDNKDAIIKDQAALTLVVQEQMELADRRQTLRETAWQISLDLFDRAKQLLNWPISAVHKEEIKEDDNGRPATYITVIEPIRWKMSDIAQMVDVANRVARLAVDLPTEIIDITGEIMQIARRNEIDLMPILRELKQQLEDATK